MSAYDSASAYHQSSAFGASAVGQVVALYDTILRDLHRAIAGLDAGQVEQRINAANHALTVIGELQGVLDFERGGEVARHLGAFYNVARALLTEASVNSSRPKFQELVGMFAQLRSAWSQVERTAAPSEAHQRLRISSKTSQTQPAYSQTSPPPPDNSEGSGSGGWSA